MKINVTLTDGSKFSGEFSNRSDNFLYIIVEVNNDEDKKRLGELIATKTNGIYMIRKNYEDKIEITIKCEEIESVVVE